ncbi:MAG: ABC transporter ATP-binding protein [Promethearchaeota archaeon]
MSLDDEKVKRVFHESGRVFELEEKSKVNIFNLYKIYKRDKIEVIALRGLDLNVNKGEFLMIMGPSGCGKTTLLNLIGGLDKPTAGKIFIDGKDITDLNFNELTNFRRENIGFVFQFMNLVESLNTFENVELPLIAIGMPKEKRKERVNTLLDIVGLKERRLHLPAELSGGEQQRVAIAAALANFPKILLADEPTGELDSKNAREVMDVFKKLMEDFPEMSVIMVTHDLSLKKYADRIVQMNDGLIEETLSLGYVKDFQGIKSGDGENEAIIQQQLNHVHPEIPFISEIKKCPKCQSSNIQILLMKSKHVQQPHQLIQIKDAVIICNNCNDVSKEKVKIYLGGL